MKTGMRVAVILLTVVGCVGCDQLTKSVARNYLAPGMPVSLLNDVIRLQRAENPGASLSLGNVLSTNTRRVLFTFGGAVLVVGTAFWALRSRRLSSAQIGHRSHESRVPRRRQPDATRGTSMERRGSPSSVPGRDVFSWEG
jgi:lipoprotein signal peptidase